MAAADRAAVTAGATTQALMERAGEAVASAALARSPTGSMVVLCGPGDNGGDGYVAARLLKQQGIDVAVEALAPPGSTAAAVAAKRWSGPTGPFGERASRCDLVIDALFGAGLNRRLPPEAARLARNLERAKVPVLAVDVPSGLSGDTGAPYWRRMLQGGGDRDLPPSQARACVAARPGVVRRNAGRGHRAWRVRCEPVREPTIPMARHSSPTGCLRAQAQPWFIGRGQRRSLVDGRGATGCASRPEDRRAGLVIAALPPRGAPDQRFAHLEAIMLRGFETEAELEMAASDVEAAVIGPAAGVTEATLSNVLALARTGAALVLDADALTVFRDEPEELFSVLDRDDVLTPHSWRVRARVSGLAGFLPGAGDGRPVGGGQGSGRRAAQRARHGDRRAGRTGRGEPQRRAVVGHGRVGRCLGRLHRRPSGARHGKLLRGVRRGLDSRLPGGRGASERAWISEDLPPAFAPRVLKELRGESSSMIQRQRTEP